MEEDKVKIKRTRRIICCLLLIIFIGIVIKLLPLFTSLVDSTGRAEFGNKIKSLGFVGAMQILLLEICKVVVVVLPGEPIELLAGMCFGPILGTVIIYMGVTLSTVAIYLTVKKYGLAIVEDIVPEEKFKKITTVLNDQAEKVEKILFVLYFLPLVPKDFLTYIGSLLPISLKKFLLITLIARFPSIISSTIVGDKIIEGDVKTIVLAYGITYMISFLVAYIYKKKKHS
jgi:uncharacterized membrane protein YdjX (TVP38/TMEM64 family)